MSSWREDAEAEEQERIRAARLWAEWHIGDRNWADEILWAYNNPASATRQVRDELSEGD